MDVRQVKEEWTAALQSAESFVAARPPEEVGCLYYEAGAGRFINPESTKTGSIRHYGRPGGVLPRVAE
jgi:hypothetical protein